MTRDEILRAIQHAENFTPHKIEYYKEMLKELDTTNSPCTKCPKYKVNCYYTEVINNNCPKNCASFIN